MILKYLRRRDSRFDVWCCFYTTWNFNVNVAVSSEKFLITVTLSSFMWHHKYSLRRLQTMVDSSNCAHDRGEQLCNTLEELILPSTCWILQKPYGSTKNDEKYWFELDKKMQKNSSTLAVIIVYRRRYWEIRDFFDIVAWLWVTWGVYVVGLSYESGLWV